MKQPAVEDRRALEELAWELARAAGVEIALGFGEGVSFRYKDPAGERPTDPVSEVDLAIERQVRAQLETRFPHHAVIGEEEHLRPGDPTATPAVTWVIDPVDGTSNFLHGFPLIASSIGVLVDGVPVTGAVWCSVSHALRNGVYHTWNGALAFDREPVIGGRHPGMERALIGDARGVRGLGDVRITGSAAFECAQVAAGVFSASRLRRPSIWDVAGGIALITRAGGEVWEEDPEAPGTWRPFQDFGTAPFREWCRALLLLAPGSPVDREALPPPGA